MHCYVGEHERAFAKQFEPESDVRMPCHRSEQDVAGHDGRAEPVGEMSRLVAVTREDFYLWKKKSKCASFIIMTNREQGNNDHDVVRAWDLFKKNI